MKKIGYIFIVICTLLACNQPNKEITSRITHSDSLAINYFSGDGSMDTVVEIRIIRDKEKINQLAAAIGKRSLEGDYKCGYDGSLHFFKMNKVIQDVYFRFNADDCRYFFFQLNGKQQATELSAGSKELINAFRK